MSHLSRNTETSPSEKYNGIPVTEGKRYLGSKKTTSFHLFKRQSRQKIKMPQMAITSEVGRVDAAAAGQIFKTKMPKGWITLFPLMGPTK